MVPTSVLENTRTLLLDGRNIEKKVIVCQESKHTTYCGPLGMMAVEGNRAAFKEVPDPGGSAGRVGIAWIRTKESLKTKGQATWVSSVLPLGRGKLAEVILEGRNLREGIIDARGSRRGMGFGLGASVGQPEAEVLSLLTMFGLLHVVVVSDQEKESIFAHADPAHPLNSLSETLKIRVF
jgi:hypothetical protein